MSGRLLSNDPITRSREEFHYDQGDDTFVINQVQDVSPVTDANKRAYNDAPGRFGEGLVHKVASIPLAVWADLQKRGIADDEKALKKWLDDRDNQVFRTRPGRLGR